jgi:hypothetical protein
MSDFDSGRVRVTSDASAAGLEATPLATGEILTVPASTLQTIVTYTATSPKVLVSQITVTGTVYSMFQLYLNTVLIETRRGGPDRTMSFEFVRPLKLVAGDILDVKASHGHPTETADYNSTVYGG